MKYIKIYFFALVAAALSSCIKDNKVTFTDTVFEFDAATYNANAGGVTYPILTRIPGYGKAVIGANTTTGGVTVPADPLITRTSGTIKFRINLVGPQRSTPTTVNYRVVPLTANTTTPTIQPAVQGTHFNTSGTVTIPANSNFGEVEVQIINPGTTSTVSRDVVLEILSSSDVKPSENEKLLGIRISQI